MKYLELKHFYIHEVAPSKNKCDVVQLFNCRVLLISFNLFKVLHLCRFVLFYSGWDIFSFHSIFGYWL